MAYALVPLTHSDDSAAVGVGAGVNIPLREINRSHHLHSSSPQKIMLASSDSFSGGSHTHYTSVPDQDEHSDSEHMIDHALLTSPNSAAQQQQQQQQRGSPQSNGSHLISVAPYNTFTSPQPVASSAAVSSSSHPSGGVTISDTRHPDHHLHIGIPHTHNHNHVSEHSASGMMSGERSVRSISQIFDATATEVEEMIHEERRCCGICNCNCGRCLSHCWFLTACCGFIFLSSLPRILTLCDFIVTILIYSLSFSNREDGSGNESNTPSLTFWTFLQDDFTHYSFHTSGASLIILSFLRSCILFVTFAYRYHLHPMAFVVATVVMCFSLVFISIKFILNTNHHLIPLLVWCLCISAGEYLVWLALRRRRITARGGLGMVPSLGMKEDTTALLHVSANIDDTKRSSLSSENGGGYMIRQHERSGSGTSSHGSRSPIGSSLGASPRVQIMSSSSSLRNDDGPVSTHAIMPDILTSSSSRQVQSYQRFHESETVVGADRGMSSGASSVAGSYASSSFNPSSTFNPPPSSSASFAASFPRAPLESEYDPLQLADPDSLFMQIDSLLVHYKLSVNGKPVLPGGALNSGASYTNASNPRSKPDMVSSPKLQSQASAAAVASAFHLNGNSSSSSHGASSPLSFASSSSSNPGASFSSSTSSTQFKSPVILLHGFGSSLFAFRTIWHDLAQHVPVLLAFDRPGFGLTTRLVKDAANTSSDSYGTYIEKNSLTGKQILHEQKNPYTQEYSCELLHKLIYRLGLQSSRSVIVAHSTGGTIGLRSLLTTSSKLYSGLFFISPNLYSTGFPTILKSLLKTRLGKMITQQLIRTELGEVTMKRAWYDSTTLPQDALVYYQRIGKVKGFIEGLQEIAAAVPNEQANATTDPHHNNNATSSSSTSTDSLSSRFYELRGSSHRPSVPVCILHGIQDKLLDVSESIRAYREMTADGVACTLIKIEHCGHVPHEEFPELTLEHLYSFMRECEGGGETHAYDVEHRGSSGGGVGQIVEEEHEEDMRNL